MKDEADEEGINISFGIVELLALIILITTCGTSHDVERIERRLKIIEQRIGGTDDKAG